MVGRRRIGKTSLLLESMKGEKFLYLFVSRKSEVLLCEQFQQEIKDSLELEIFGNVTEFRILFEQLMIYATQTHFTLSSMNFRSLTILTVPFSVIFKISGIDTRSRQK